MGLLTRGQHISGPTIGGRRLEAAVVNENQVRAAAGLTMMTGVVAFAYAYFDDAYTLLQIAASLFLVEFLTRLTLGIRYSPFGVVGHLLTRSFPADWVSAKPKNFAWTMGLGLSFAMTIITNSGIRGWLPRSICLICITLMWLESVLGFCVGCQIHAWLVRRGWTTKDPAYEICTHGVCELPPHPARRVSEPDVAAAGTRP